MTTTNFRASCHLVSEPTCHNCAYGCWSEGDPCNACRDWKPCRGGTPSTPNICEGTYSSLEEYPLCLPEQCVQCACNPFASRTA